MTNTKSIIIFSHTMEIQHQRREEFLNNWPIERVKNMSIREYTNLNKDDSFCYWLESHTTNLGSIWGGSAFKFGIYEKSNKSTKFESSGRLSDDDYAWYSKYGKSKEEAFKKILSLIVEIIELSINKDFEKIEYIDLGEAVKWKIAYLYSGNDILCVFNRNLLERICEFLNIDYSSKDSFHNLQAKLMSNKGIDEEYFSYYNRLIDILNYNSTEKRYWIYAPGENASYWDEFYENGIMALGWDELVDLGTYNSKKDIAVALKTLYGGETDKKNDANANYDLYKNINVGDIVIVKRGRNALLGYGEVLSEYYYDESRDDFTHCRKVNWIKKGQWNVNESLVLKTLTNITNYISSKNSNLKYYQELLNIMNIEETPNNTIINLLEYKKQIILQGPPGTGKTRQAKLIAKSFLGLYEKLDIEFFKVAVLPIKEIQATNNNNTIFIDFIKDDVIYFKKNGHTDKYSFTLNDLYDCYISEDYKKNDFVQYPQYSKRCLVLYLLKNYKKTVTQEQFKLIQFHPSYTYEDFVRGIVAKPNPEGEGMLYEAENKTLGAFAKKALKNFIDSKKDQRTISKEAQINEYFDNFVEFLNDEIESKNRFYSLTDNVGLISTDDTAAFRYKGKNEGWLKNGNRILFKDLLESYFAGDKTRQEIKKNIKISGLARQHASYFVRVLNLFQKYLKDNNLENKESTDVKRVDLKNYVLVIDEINRANLSSVLGELIYALEYRGEAVESMYAIEDESGNKLILPPNLYIIGTMNTADRSVGHIDYAIRRRFAFVDVAAENLRATQGLETFDDGLFNEVAALFDTNLSPEFEKKDVQLGHSYFIDKSSEKDGATMAIRLEYEIIPILREYIRDGVLTGENIKEKIEALAPSI